MRPWIVLAVVCATGAQAQAPAWPAPPHQILVLGTFHFRDAGLDSYRPTHDIDILSAGRQRELADVVERLATFRPTRIAVEVQPGRQSWLDSTYQAYLAGRFELPAGEIYQIGFRLARRLGHTRLYAVDAQRRFYEPWVDPDSYAVANGQRAMLDPDLEARYTRSHEFDDERKTRLSLRETLLYMNEPARLLRSHGQYLIGNFEVGTHDEYPGVDSKTAWFNRNLRIFANLQRLVTDPAERILLIIGAGHAPILRHSIEASPQFDLVEVSAVLGSR